MPELIKDPANPNPGSAAEVKEEASVIDEAGKEAPEAGKDDTILDAAGKEAEAAKAAQAAEEKRILEADETTLSDADKTKKVGIVKARDEKKLLETPDDQLTQEQKDQKAALVKARDEAAAASKVPADGKYVFKVPEGMVLDEALVAEISPVLKQHNITQAAAQAIADVYAKKMVAIEEAQATAFKNNVDAWKKETYEALGADAKEKLVFVAKVRDRLLSPETREILKASGIANCKPLIFDLIKIGELITEDNLPPAPPASSDVGKEPAKVLYPDQP